MALTKDSKIKEVWRHPAGHDILRLFFKRSGYNPRWAENLIVSNLPVAVLEGPAGSGFVEALLEIVNTHPDMAMPQEDVHEEWWKEAVAYRLYVPSFMDSDHDGIGDIGGVIQRLPYLANLGVNLLWLCSLSDETGSNDRTIDYTDINPNIGLLADVEELAEAAHRQNMKLVLDMNITATPENHAWFQAALSNQEPYKEYYIFKEGSATRPPNNWTRRTGGVAWNWYATIQEWGLCLQAPHLVDLNWDNMAVKEEICKLLSFWMEKGIDGFSFGPVNTISKNNFSDGNEAMGSFAGLYGFEKYAFGPQLSGHMGEINKWIQNEDENIMVAGKIRGIGTHVARVLTKQEGCGLDMIMDAEHLYPKGKPIKSEDGNLSLLDLKDYYIRWMADYGNKNWMPVFFENSSTPRMISRLGANPVYRSILAKLLGTMMLTMRGTPLIYQGEELGLPNTRFASSAELRDKATLRLFKELRENSDEGDAFQKIVQFAPDHARVTMPWSTGLNAGFTGAQPWMRAPDGFEYLNAAVQMGDSNSVWQHYRKLICLRKENKALVYGSFNPVFAKNKSAFCYFRILDGEKWYVEINLSEKEISRPGRLAKSQKLLLSNYDTPTKRLRPYEANIYRCE